MNENSKKINFFGRLKIAIVKLEEYGRFLEEKTFIAIKYFLLLAFIFATSLAGIQTYLFSQAANRGYSYIKNELPEFSYENKKLNFENTINAYDEKLDFYLIADTTENLEKEKIEEYKKNVKSSGIIFLNDKMIYDAYGEEMEIAYEEIEQKYDISYLNKDGLVEKIDSIGLGSIAITMFVAMLVTGFVVAIISLFMDWLIITIFAYFVSKICRVNIKFKQAFNISIYALTLSIILSVLYNIAYYLFDFYIEYFRIIYLLISYVYIVAAILIIKSDLIKQNMEVAKIEKVQKEIKEEMQKEEENNEDGKKEDDNRESKDELNNSDSDTDKNIDVGEPDGSEI